MRFLLIALSMLTMGSLPRAPRDRPSGAADDGVRSVRVYGTTGTIMGVASRTSRDSTGARRTQRSNFLEVFVKRDGRWQAVAGHYFPVTDDR